MEYEIAKIPKVTGYCPACEEYAEQHSTNPPKIAVMACEGCCAKGEVARRAATMVAQRLARDETVRICLGGAFTRDTGQRSLVRRAEKVIAVEGCFIACASRMMAGVLPDLLPVVILADTLYDEQLPFGADEVPDEMFSVYACKVAEQIVNSQVKPAGPCGKPDEKSACSSGGCAPKHSHGCGQ